MKSRGVVVKGIGKKSRGHTLSSSDCYGAAEESAGNKLYPDVETSTTYSPHDRDASRSRKNITAKRWKHVATADESCGGVSSGCRPAGISTTGTTSSRPPLLPRNGKKTMFSRIKNKASGKENTLGGANSQTSPSSSVQTASSHRNTVSKQSDGLPLKLMIDISTPRVQNSGLVDLDDVSTSDDCPWSCGADLAAPSWMSAAAVSTKRILNTCVDLDLSFSDDEEDDESDREEECHNNTISSMTKQRNIHGDEVLETERNVDTHDNLHVMESACDSYGCMSPADVVSCLYDLIIDEENDVCTEADTSGHSAYNYEGTRTNTIGAMGKSQYMYVGTGQGTIAKNEPKALFKADSFRSLQSEATRVADNRSFNIHSNYTFEV